MPFMNSNEIDDQLHDLTEDLFERSLKGKTILGSFGPPFDTTKANIHNSKAEFQAELNAVTAIVDHVRSIIDVFFSEEQKSKPDHKDMVMRLRVAFQISSAKEVDKRPLETPNDLVLGSGPINLLDAVRSACFRFPKLRGIMSNLYWLSEDQMARLRP